jgi:endo-1,4-beta-xylanase
MSADTVVSRRSVLAGAAGTAVAGLVGGGLVGTMANPAAAAPLTGVPPLWRTAYKNGIVYGTAWATWQDGGRYRSLVNREAAVLFTQDDLLWYVLKPTPDSPLDFSYADRFFARAERQGMLVVAAHLVWDEGFGEGWTEADLWEISEKRARRLLFGTLRETVRRYRGRVAAWLVCTEVTDPEGRRGVRTNVPWYQTIGPEYISEAFAIAREEDDEATLVLNETGFETVNEYGDSPYDQQKATLQVIDMLIRQGTRPDALGVQAHLLADRFAERFHPGRYQRFLREVTDRGLDILITEMDVNDDGLPRDVERRDRMVASVYRRYLDAALDNEGVRAVISFGLSDKYSSLDEDYPRPDGAHRRGVIFDRRMLKKPAFGALRASLIDADQREPLWEPPRAAGPA